MPFDFALIAKALIYKYTNYKSYKNYKIYKLSIPTCSFKEYFMKKSFFAIVSILALAALLPAGSNAQSRFRNTYIVKENKSTTPNDSSKSFLGKNYIDALNPKPLERFTDWCRNNNVFNNLEVAATIGTGGLGLELATPITTWTRLRAGVEWMPSFHIPMDFDIASFKDGGVSNDISHIQEMVYEMTGLEMDNNVKMIAKPTIFNFKLLVDVFPFQENKHWHFTAGFYVGKSVVGRAENKRDQMTTLVALNLYNRAYDYFTNIKDIYDVPLGGGNYLDPDQVLELQEKFREYGRIGIHIGDFKDGKPYMMEPSKDGYVRAKAKTNIFKPYLGFGYSGSLDREKKWNVGVEAGVMFWGGAPEVIVHDGVNMTKDLEHVRGKVGTCLDLVKAVPVYPLVDFKISYSFF